MRLLLGRLPLAIGTAAALGLTVGGGSLPAAASTPTGQVALGQSTVEPASNDANGQRVFLLTPDQVPFPSISSPTASSPMNIPMYPMGSGFSAADLNCQPTNCDHLNVLPGPLVEALRLTSVYPISPGTSALCEHFDPFLGLPAGTPCAAVEGHDHLIGVRSTGGDFNVAWHVFLFLFTSTPSTRISTLTDLQAAQASGLVVGPIDSGIVFNCSIVSGSVYAQGTPLSF